MGVSELVMSGNAPQRVKGCGKDDQTLTLYYVSLFDGTGRPLSQGFINHACGSCASTFQKMTYGIMLCPSCANQLGFAPLPWATKARDGTR
jgi:predicted amidophosphoribosyltransferase